MQIKLRSNKRGTLETNEIIEIILAAGAIVVLLLLFLGILNVGYDKNQEVMKSYFNILKEQVSIGEKEIGEFQMWQEETDVFYYLIYFGDKRSFSFDVNGKQQQGLLDFFPSKTLCICMFKDEVFCDRKYCLDLHTSAKYSKSQGEQWVIRKGEKAFIQEINNEYVFDVR